MFNGIFGKYWERGSSPPPPPPTAQAGSGLKAFGVCTPCCDGGFTSETFCLMNDPSYRGRIAIINGGGIFPLDYKGLNELGYECWRGIVKFTHGIAGTLKLHEPVGSPYRLTDMNSSIDDPFFSSDPCFFTPELSLRGFTKDAWNSIGKNLGGIADIVEQYYLCTRHELIEKTVNFPDVEYEYYRIPNGENFSWMMRFRYNSSEQFAFPVNVNNILLSGFHPYMSYGSGICQTIRFINGYPSYEAGTPQYNLYPYDKLSPNYFKLPGEIQGSFIEERTPILFGNDSYFWNWVVPIYSNDMLNTHPSLYFNTNRAYDVEYEGPVYSWQFIYGTEPFTPRLAFVGVTENDRTLQANYTDPFGYNNYYSDLFNPKFAITVTHPFFPSTYIEDTASLYLNKNIVNSRNYYAQESFMFANGFFRSIVPYPIPKSLDPSAIIPGRTSKVSSRLNCQISSPSGVVNCVLNLCDASYFGGEPEQIGHYAAYYGQPDKYSFIKYEIQLNSNSFFYDSFEYIKINPNGKMYSKMPLGGLFDNLENIKLNFCPALYPNKDLVLSLFDYGVHSLNNCDPTLADAYEINPSAIVKVFKNKGYIRNYDNPPIVINDYPMILGFEAKAVVKISKNPPSFISEICDFSEACGGGTIETLSETILGDDITITYETANVTLTELP